MFLLPEVHEEDPDECHKATGTNSDPVHRLRYINCRSSVGIEGDDAEYDSLPSYHNCSHVASFGEVIKDLGEGLRVHVCPYATKQGEESKDHNVQDLHFQSEMQQ